MFLVHMSSIRLQVFIIPLTLATTERHHFWYHDKGGPACYAILWLRLASPNILLKIITYGPGFYSLAHAELASLIVFTSLKWLIECVYHFFCKYFEFWRTTAFLSFFSILVFLSRIFQFLFLCPWIKQGLNLVRGS